MRGKNIPYTKQYDENGLPIPFPKDGYINLYPNRKERRMVIQKQPHRGNTKGVSLSISGNIKYHRTLQLIKDEFGRVIKTINHYLLK